jgi:hypothetical protein
MKETNATTGNGKPPGAERADFEESCQFVEALLKAFQLNGISSQPRS